jgi:TatD DNase family protein
MNPEKLALVDIGANLMSSAFDGDRNTVLESAWASGLEAVIITGSTIEDNIRGIAFAKTHPRCKATSGVHPHHAKDWDEAMLAQLQDVVLRETHSPFGAIVAIGECGLDYNRNFSPPDAQRRCFEDQLVLASALKKPVFLHERDAFDDFSAILRRHRSELPGAVVHCFTGGEAELEAYLALDCYIGITGWVCDERRGSHLIPLLRRIPADRLLLETDAPYLLPRCLPKSVRGKSGRNEMQFLPAIAAFVAKALDKTPEQIALETTANAKRLFQLDER